MKNILFLIIVLISFQSYTQTKTDQLSKIITLEDAKKFATENPNFETELIEIQPEIDSTSFARNFTEYKVGDILSDNEYFYKILFETKVKSFRVSYIFLDANKISIKEIEKIRTKILQDYRKGVPFVTLANKYKMDNSKDGDLGWFSEGMMVPDFEIAIKNHNQNDIFKVNVPTEKWYYVVLKTYKDKQIKNLSVLKIKNIK